VKRIARRCALYRIFLLPGGGTNGDLVNDDWSIGKLDVDAYLRRINYSGRTEPSEATLVAIYRSHLREIRFENFDVFLRGGVAVDLESIQEKIVFRGRGGYCYEQAQLFGAVLERLGFTVDRMLARVGPDGGPATARTHLTLRVQSGTGAWLADPGFGNSPPAPLSLRRYRSGGPQEVDGWIYEIAPDQENGDEVWKLREYQGGEWVTLHRWDDTRAHPVDVVLSNHYTSTHRDSWFTRQPILVRRDPDAVRSIVRRSYTITRPGHVKERRVLTDAEFAAALTDEFALKLTTDEIATLVAAPIGPPSE
jgi:N-hydroxyarylamine O-acetyltransferase